jgi:hypothetical protein
MRELRNTFHRNGRRVGGPSFVRRPRISSPVSSCEWSALYDVGLTATERFTVESDRRSFADRIKRPPLIYARPLLIFPFPLIPGKSWSDETRWQIPDLSQGGRSVIAGKVGEWEQVAVPAGIFHALRVDVTIRGIGRLGWNDTTFITYWYAPECNRLVKLHYGDENQGIVDAERVSYKPARW